jgi:MscS family membrane protein
MKNSYRRNGSAGTLAAVLLLVALADGRVLAQPAVRDQAPPTTASELPKDSLGRDTPRGAVLGFMRAGRDGQIDAAAFYLDSTAKVSDRAELARKLYVVLDRRLPARLTDISDRPEGARANPLKPDQDVVGSITTSNGVLEIIVERHTPRGGAAPAVWLFSRQTLDRIPEVYGEIEVISLNRYLPGVLGTFRFGGIRVVVGLTLVLLLLLFFKLLALVRTPGALRPLLIALGIHWMLTTVDLPLRERQLCTAAAALLIMASGTWIMLGLNAFGEQYARRHFQHVNAIEIGALVRLGRRIADILVVVAGATLAIAYFGGDPTAALAGLGIGGIAVALAAQKTLENVIGGLSLIFDKAVRAGDFLKLGDVLGTVDSIGLRSTRIRTLDRTIVSVPNSQIANTSVETLSARDMCWFHHILGLGHETTSDQLRRVMDGLVHELITHPLIEPQSIRVRLLRVGMWSFDIEVFAYALTGDWGRFLEIQEQLLVSLLKIVDDTGARIATPVRVLHAADAATAEDLASPTCG